MMKNNDDLIIILYPVVDECKEGNFSGWVKLNEWFKHGRYNYIWALIEGLDKKIDYDLLYFTIQGLKLYLNINYEKFTDKRLKEDLKYMHYLQPVDHLSHEVLVNIFYGIQKKWLKSLLKTVSNHPEYESLIPELDLLDREKVSSGIPITDTEMGNLTLSDPDSYAAYSSDYDDYIKIVDGHYTLDDIDTWFDEYNFKMLRKVISNCINNQNTEFLKYIVLRCNEMIENPKITGLNDSQKEEILGYDLSWYEKSYSQEELASVLKDNIAFYFGLMINRIIRNIDYDLEGFKDVLEQLSNSGSDMVRLYCCAKYDYTRFLEDSDDRVRKVAKIRRDFDDKWDTLDDNEKERINFIYKALKTHAISLINDGNVPPDKVWASFSSFLFDDDNSKDQPRFDRDIFSTIADKRILAAEINEMIKRGDIILKPEFEPMCFKSNSSTKN